MIQIVTNVVVQTIILLYLIDNSEQTSWMILMGSGVGIVIEAWKVGVMWSAPLLSCNVYSIAVWNRSRKRWISALGLRPLVHCSRTRLISKVRSFLSALDPSWSDTECGLSFTDKHVLSEDEKKTQE